MLYSRPTAKNTDNSWAHTADYTAQIKSNVTIATSLAYQADSSRSFIATRGRAASRTAAHPPRRRSWQIVYLAMASTADISIQESGSTSVGRKNSLSAYPASQFMSGQCLISSTVAGSHSSSTAISSCGHSSPLCSPRLRLQDAPGPPVICHVN